MFLKLFRIKQKCETCHLTQNPTDAKKCLGLNHLFHTDDFDV